MNALSAEKASPAPAPSRREQLLKTAAELFMRYPYDAVTVEMICSRAGISGPGLYRHFANKQALLVAVVENPLTQLTDFARRVNESEPDPGKALATLVDYHIRMVLGAEPTTLIFMKNEHAVPEEDQRRIRREMSRYSEEWASVVRVLRPDLSYPEVRLLTQTTFTMLNSLPTLNKGLDTESVVRTMSVAALNALTLPG